MLEGQASGETGLEERTILLPTGQHSESNGTETKKPTFAGGLFRLEYGGSCRIRTYDQLVKSHVDQGRLGRVST
ncbi:hypothetical protein, partial [Pseudomonas aeruginosa]|uniref:hypothetical protein n=1 Tax=Pseudomonas aeruginosa TaxID=287 RepID=UPI003D7B3A3A